MRLHFSNQADLMPLMRRRASKDAVPELFVTQLQPAVLSWEELGLRLNLTSDLYSAHRTARVGLQFSVLGNADSVHVLLKLRIPGCALLCT